MGSASGEIIGYSSFGEWLLHWRKARGFSQEALARRAGDVCTGAYLSALERRADIGKKGQPTRPSEEIVDALAAALDRPLAEARHAAGYTAPGEQPDREEIATGIIAALYQRLNKLSPDRRALFEHILAMVERELRHLELSDKEQREASRLLGASNLKPYKAADAASPRQRKAR